MAVPGTLRLGMGLRPERVHDDAGHTWHVDQVLAGWKRPGTAPELYGYPGVIQWWRMAVWGPLPGDPARRGEFVMVAERRGDRPGWWLTLEPCPWRGYYYASSKLANSWVILL